MTNSSLFVTNQLDWRVKAAKGLHLYRVLGELQLLLDASVFFLKERQKICLNSLNKEKL